MFVQKSVLYIKRTKRDVNFMQQVDFIWLFFNDAIETKTLREFWKYMH